jgi:uncharacterized membrane protein YdjX (TVP38/TMEM64 family)
MAAIRGDLPEAVTQPRTADDARLGRSAVVRFSALAALIAATVVAGHFIAARMDLFAAVREWVNGAGNAGPLLFVVLFLALNTLGVPLPVLGTVAGVVFGPVSGSTTLLAAMTITACVQFLLARYVAGERVRRRLGHALGRADELLQRRGMTAVAAARLLPGPFSEFNMLAGLTSLAVHDFTIGTVIGCAPKALAWSGLGALLFGPR